MKLTLRTINAIPASASSDVFVWDDKLSGFGIRVKSSGVRSFILQYRNASGLSRRITLGRLGVLTVERARELARTELENIAGGGDPATDRREQRTAMTVAQLCMAYLESADKRLVLGKGGRPKKKSTLYFDRGRIVSTSCRCSAHKRSRT